MGQCLLATVGTAALVGAISYGYVSVAGEEIVVTYDKNTAPLVPVATVAVGASTTTPAAPPVTHISTPASVKGIYMTSWIAGTPRLRARVLDLLQTTELNTVVIDIKDDTGRISFAVDDPVLQRSGAVHERIRDIDALLAELHKRGVYVIGRIAVFQDPFLASSRPDLALHTKSGDIWRDRKGLTWLQQRSPDVWAYVARIAHAAYEKGFDEINFDYIRFPTDGDTDSIDYGLTASTTLDKVAEMERFMQYLDTQVRRRGIPTSADIFGQITSAHDDMGIGQSIERAAPYFDYLAPMVYPSHYYPGFLNLKNPAAQPYEVVKYALEEGVKKLSMASSTSQKLRPWLQDFSLETHYTPEMVQEQIKATYDAGLTSWMLWDPGNHYSRAALLPK